MTQWRGRVQMLLIFPVSDFTPDAGLQVYIQNAGGIIVDVLSVVELA